MKDIELQISQFIDNELSDAEQKELFTVLSEDETARRTLADFMRMKKSIAEHHNNVEITLSKSLLNHTHPQKLLGNNYLLNLFSFKYKTPVYINYVLIIVILAVSFFSYFQLSSLRLELDSFQKKYTTSTQQIKEQTEMVKILLKSLPSVKVTPFDSGQIINTNL